MTHAEYVALGNPDWREHLYWFCEHCGGFWWPMHSRYVTARRSVEMWNGPMVRSEVCPVCGGGWLEEPSVGGYDPTQHFWGYQLIGPMPWVFMGAEHTRVSAYEILAENVHVPEWMHPQLGILEVLYVYDPLWDVAHMEEEDHHEIRMVQSKYSFSPGFSNPTPSTQTFDPSAEWNYLEEVLPLLRHLPPGLAQSTRFSTTLRDQVSDLAVVRMLQGHRSSNVESMALVPLGDTETTPRGESHQWG